MQGRHRRLEDGFNDETMDLLVHAGKGDLDPDAAHQGPLRVREGGDIAQDHSRGRLEGPHGSAPCGPALR